MIDHINTASNVVILAFCAWVVLDKRVHTRFIGTVLISIVGMCAVLNIARPDFGLAWFLPEHYAVVLNVAIACKAVWFWWCWKDPRRVPR